MGPGYTNESCDLIVSHQNCLKNGRPDREFLYWRWAPRDCDLPQLDPERFLYMMWSKAWALVGDSISLNNVQSLLCILAKVCLHTQRMVLLTDLKSLLLFFYSMRIIQVAILYLCFLPDCVLNQILFFWFQCQMLEVGLFTLNNKIKDLLLFK